LLQQTTNIFSLKFSWIIIEDF